ncbi:MAG: helix-turn-helix domain-containing protein [Candidatus Gallimonas sp.]
MAVGFIDWKTDFAHPETGVELHWWNKPEITSSDFYISEHSHNHYEFFILTKGRVRHVLNGKEMALKTGVVQFIRPGDIHGFRLFPGEQCEHVNIAITEGMFRKLCDVLGVDVYEYMKNSRENTFKLSLEDFGSYVHMAQIVTASPSDDPEMYAMFVKNLIVNLIVCFRQRQTLGSDSRPRWFQDLIYELHQPRMLNVTAKEVYALANYSPAMINKYFRQYTDMTVTEYLRTIKLNYAKNMLEKTNFTALTISMRLGFDSLSYFNSMFKREVGKTPNQYRLESRGKLKENDTEGKDAKT